MKTTITKAAKYRLPEIRRVHARTRLVKRLLRKTSLLSLLHVEERVEQGFVVCA